MAREKVSQEMTVRERQFFNLYNSPDYFDKLFGCKTYHNAVMTYMVLNCKNNEKYKAYGDINRKKYCISEDGNIHLDLSASEYAINNFDEFSNNNFGDFYFRDQKAYLEILAKANEYLMKPSILEASKDLAKSLGGGLEQMREKLIMTAYDITQDKHADAKSRNEALKIVGNWLGIEKNEQVANVNVVMGGIEAGLRALEEEK